MTNLKIKENVSINSINNQAFVPGDIIIYQSGTIPDGWISCDGQLVNNSDYPDLYSKIGTYYGSGTNQFKIPNLNGVSLSNPIYPTGMVGDPPSYTVPSYSSHTHTISSVAVNSSSFTSANHNHSYSIGSNNTADNHTHGAVNVTDNYGRAWTNGASNVANYTSSGTSGSHSYSSHRHNFSSATLNNGAGGTAHAHTFSGNNDALGATNHSHTGNVVTTSNTSGDTFPVSLSCRFIIKV